MKVGEMIAMVDRLKPNKFTASEKYRWLSDIEGMIVREVIETHEGGSGAGFSGYQEGRDEEKELIAPYPYDVLYRWYLESQIDMGNMEIGKYNNTRSLFNQAYLTYTDWYNRTHLPLRRGGFRFTERREAVKDALSS